MIIKTNEFTLQPIRVSDAQGYLACHRDNEAKENFSSVPQTLAEAKKEILDGKRKNKKFAILVKGEFAGFISLELTKHPRYKHSAIVGYGIHEDFRGMGLATKTLKKITAYGFNELKLKRISGMCRTHNKASQRVLEKAGFTHEGTLRKNKCINGKFLDDMIWAKVK